jgi:Superinfection immunity protein
MAPGYASCVARAFLIIVFLVLWFLPLIIATLYKLPHQGRIAVLSIALGWTGIAWLAAFTIVVGGAIRATEPPAPGTREWPESLTSARGQTANRAPATDRTLSADRTLSPGRTLPPERTPSSERTPSPERTGSPGPSQDPEQPSFPRVRSPWPGSER